MTEIQNGGDCFTMYELIKAKGLAGSGEGDQGALAPVQLFFPHYSFFQILNAKDYFSRSAIGVREPFV